MAGKEIPITDLGAPQLNQLAQQLDQEIEFIQSSMSQLKVVQTKFTESKESLDKLTPHNTGKDILVPLTSSMYVTGQLSESDQVIVDIGTGYYVEKKIKDAQEYFTRRTDYLTKQMEKLQGALQEKFKMKQVIIETLQAKVHAQIAAHPQAQKS